MADESLAFRFETRLPLRHTDTFAGTPFVHGGVLLALTEIALEAYDEAIGAPPSQHDALRMQSHTEVRYLAPLRWDDAAPGEPAGSAIVRLRCARVTPGRLTYEAEVARPSDGATVARMTHRYAFVGATSGRAELPARWPALVNAIRAFEPAVEVNLDA